MKTLLLVHASPRHDSLSVTLAMDVAAQLQKNNQALTIKKRDVSANLPYITEETIGAAYTPADSRTEAQKKLLAVSNELITELEQTDALIIATPMWNFSLPAQLKTWVDQITAPSRTFRFNADGNSEGLLKNRKTYLVITTGGVPIGSPYDHLTPALKTMLGFVGITDIEVIAAEGTNKPNAAEAIAKTRETIQKIAA